MGQTQGKVTTYENPEDGVVSREDLGDGLTLTRGMHGEVSVQVADGVVVTPELRVRINDIVIEHSAPGKEKDARHSSHPDYQLTDGTYANKETKDASSAE